MKKFGIVKKGYAIIHLIKGTGKDKMIKRLIIMVCVISLFSSQPVFSAMSEESNNDVNVIEETSLSSYKIYLVEKADTDYRFLRIIDLSNDIPHILESSPLPSNTTISWAVSESIALLADYHYLYIKKSDRFGWALVGVNDFEFGYDFIYGGNYYYSNVGYIYGDHPYGQSISNVDFFSLPTSRDEMLELLNQDKWGHILNSEGFTVLHESPDISSNQIVTLYNGTPVKVLEEDSKWMKVRIGDSVFGFIKNTDIKKGGLIGENEASFPELYFAPEAKLYSEPDFESEERCIATNIDDLVVGKYSDSWYFVLTLDGMSGFINNEDLLSEE